MFGDRSPLGAVAVATFVVKEHTRVQVAWLKLTLVPFVFGRGSGAFCQNRACRVWSKIGRCKGITPFEDRAYVLCGIVESTMTDSVQYNNTLSVLNKEIQLLALKTGIRLPAFDKIMNK